ncbi:MAG TPA: type II secretion system F family protein [Planctomycetota bacterium]|nr:type II secretion system F family protein [Planctomycetota bacterium]
MKSFEFVALCADGRSVRGRELAASELDLDRELERRGMTLTNARAVAGERHSADARLSRDDLYALTTQLATVVGAGVPLLEGLEGIGARLARAESRLVVSGMLVSLHEGLSLSQAMERHPRAFPFVFRATVQAGEAAGALDRVLLRLARYLEWSRVLRGLTVQALIYPSILGAALVGLVLLLIYFVLPRLATLFPGGRESLPGQTRFVLAVSDFMRENWVALACGVLALGATAFLGRRHAGVRVLADRVLLRVPRLGGLVRQLATSRFAGTAATLQSAGCDVFTTLSISGDACGNAALRQSFARVAAQVRRGATLTQALEREPLVDPLLVQLVSVGERSGDLDGCLDRLVEYYDEDIPRRVKRFLALFEPLLLIGAGAVVAFILLSALLPIFRLYETL